MAVHDNSNKLSEVIEIISTQGLEGMRAAFLMEISQEWETGKIYQTCAKNPVLQDGDG